MTELENIAKELDKELVNEKDTKKRITKIQQALYKAYILNTGNTGYKRIDEPFPIRKL